MSYNENSTANFITGKPPIGNNTIKNLNTAFFNPTCNIITPVNNVFCIADSRTDQTKQNVKFFFNSIQIKII
jgi:hypothetical protein